jgi:signal transduction histidine kinase
MSSESNIPESPVSGRVLIVDDNPKNLQVLGKFLRNENYELEFAVDGLAALEWLEIKEFDLVLLDVNMAGMDGFETCRMIRSNPRLDKMPVFFLTAETLRDSVLKGFEMGAQDYITKPFDSRELIMRVKTHIALKKSMEELASLNANLERRVEERTRELDRARLKAEESDRLKTAFLMNISHEIRTPLNGILGAVKMLEHDDLERQRKDECLTLAKSSGYRLLETINDIIEISKIEAGETLVTNSTVNSDDMINAQVYTFKSHAANKGIDFSTGNMLRNRDALLNTDGVKFTRILQILLSNAFKFTRQGKIEIGSYRDGDEIVFYVSDTGIGIPAHMAEAVFKRFVQADMGLRRGHEGTGLGLAIAGAYVELMKGRIWFESEEGRGTTFYFSLPVPAIY